MKSNFRGTLIFVLLTPSLAFSCPDVQTDQVEQNRLYSGLRAASNEMNGRAVADQLWEIWITAPDEQSQELMDAGRERIRVADYERAEEIFDELIDYCTNYAEGWNQRAFVRYLRQDYGNGLVPLTFRSLNSFMRPFVQMPRGFYHPAMSDGVADCRTH
ncbi:MAG: hypothetical protein ACI84R_002745 [Candidatus Azotimanducaceae bacterium]|jgi:hypothetical protein